MEKTELYQWQEECLKKWFSNHGRGMVQAATGTGKTILALAAAERLERILDRELRIKIIVPSGALLRQWNRALRERLADSAAISNQIGLRGGGFSMSDDRRYMIYVINSARYELARQILWELRNGKAVLLIADECHHYDSGQNRLIFEFLPHSEEYRDRFFSLGLSATLPYGQAKNYLASVLGPQIYDYGMAKAAARKNICQYHIFHIALGFQPEEREEYGEMTERMSILHQALLKARPELRGLNQKGFFEQLANIAGGKDRRLAETADLYRNLSYKRKSLVCLAAARIPCALALIERLPDEERILVFGERISQAEELYRLLRERYPGRVGRYHSRLNAQVNGNTLERFRNGEFRILIACKSLDEGFDVPEASTGIILSGTSVQRQRIQRLGRLVRKKEGKEGAALYYLHITESREERCYFPEEGAASLLDLEYLPETEEFRNPRYDAAALRVSASLAKKDPDPETVAEWERCLRQGAVRSDWLLDLPVLEGHIQSSSTVRNRNYWICMKQLRAMECLK